MNRLTVIIECAEENFSAYVREVDGITATGKSIDEIKASISDAIEEFVATCKELDYEIHEVLRGDYEITFELDI